MRYVSLLAVFFTMSHTVAEAHYLWIGLEPKAGEHGTAHLYFEEGPTPGDGHYLDPFEKHGKMWVSTLKSGKPTPLKMSVSTKPGKKWLSAPLTEAGPRSVESYGKFGVYSYGKTEVLLHYYARYLDVQDHDDLHELGKTDELDLQIVPHDLGKKMELTVYWKGKPAKDVPLYLRGPDKFRMKLTTDQSGQVSFPVVGKGRYTCRTFVELKESGTDDGKDYELIRHHSSLTLDLPFGKP
ncbi:MAG: hypothetical protein KDA84_24690 [Planctomycetaceae bacterium]|nr:hypothetical protein [Planctomycetaceae bacterium]